MIQLLLVHLAPFVRELMVATLQEQPDMTVIGCVTTKNEATCKLQRCRCDVVVLDSHLPHSEADTLLHEIAQHQPAPKVLMTGLGESEAMILHYLEAGAAGYVLAEETLDEFLYKIHCVQRDEFCLPPRIATKLMARLAELKRLAIELNGFKQQHLNPKSELTLREREVLHLIEQGFTNGQIAHHLTIELGTVKNHVHSILDKLDVAKRQQAALYARQLLCGEEVNPAPHHFYQQCKGV